MEYLGSFVSDKDAYELILLWQLVALSYILFRRCAEKYKNSSIILLCYNAYIAITETIAPDFSQDLVPFELMALLIFVLVEEFNLNAIKNNNKILLGMRMK